MRIVELPKRFAAPLTSDWNRDIVLKALHAENTRYSVRIYPQQQKVVHSFMHRQICLGSLLFT